MILARAGLQISNGEDGSLIINKDIDYSKIFFINRLYLKI